MDKSQSIEASFKILETKIIEMKFVAGDGILSLNAKPVLHHHVEVVSRVSKSQKTIITFITVSAEAKIDQEKLFEINATIMGSFIGEGTSPEECEGFAKANAPAIVFPTLRAWVSNITLSAGYPPIMLPLINFQKLKVVVEVQD